MSKPSFLSLLGIAVFLGLSGFVFVQNKQLEALAARVDQVDPSNQIEQFTSRLDEIESSTKAVNFELQKAVPMADFNTAIKATSAQLDNIQRQLEGAKPSASQEEFLSLQARVESLETDLHGMQKRMIFAQNRPAPTSAERKIAIARQKKPIVLAPPFQVIGVESRGSERFLAIAPFGSTRLDDIQLIRPGDSSQQWQLKSLGDSTAEFLVGGNQQIVNLR
ncbi:methyl-accepting chemotaxis protein [Pseudomonas luteola]|uniref:Methyl-accepting chemotaxis protein n=1 Tax=Pseudomonas luteola TaxID=47886 RepID=A0A2X2C9Z0_PSELU|nr:hypothetical protein [Pseudomonas luteola]SPZ02556.1 methyl-accepting chemotaxis protein [Pseudomonas luteola]